VAAPAASCAQAPGCGRRGTQSRVAAAPDCDRRHSALRLIWCTIGPLAAQTRRAAVRAVVRSEPARVAKRTQADCLARVMRVALFPSLVALFATGAVFLASLPAHAEKPVRKMAGDRSPYHGVPYAKRD